MLIRSFYDQIILKYSKTVLLLILLGVAFLGYEARKLEIDASSELEIGILSGGETLQVNFKLRKNKKKEWHIYSIY